MCRTVCLKVSNGMDSAARVLVTLRRKNFEVREFNMQGMDDDRAKLRVTINDEKKLGFERAILQIKKLVDVYDVEVM